MTHNLSYGGEAHPSPSTVATIITKLQDYGDRELGEHTTLEVKTWDDGTIEAFIMETVDMVAGVGDVEPGTIRREVRYQSTTNELFYREVLDKSGRVDAVNNKRVLETRVLDGEQDE